MAIVHIVVCGGYTVWIIKVGNIHHLPAPREHLLMGVLFNYHLVCLAHKRNAGEISNLKLGLVLK